MLFRSVAVAALCVACWPIGSAQAQLFSTKDGYAPDGTYRVQVELAPYLWLPATSGKINFGSQRLNDTGAGNFASGIPSLSDLASTLHFSFMGAGLLRYGPYSAEMDMQYISASGSKTVFVGPDGGIYRIHGDVSMFRVAPGVGYQVFSGAIAGIPTTADARVGFSYFTSSMTLTGENRLGGRLSDDGSFVQPWLGGRIDFVPSPHWRIEAGALVQGFGVDGGSWGWGVSLIGSYAINTWSAVNFGFRALNTEREQGNGNTVAASRRSLTLTSYGPVVGFSFRF